MERRGDRERVSNMELVDDLKKKREEKMTWKREEGERCVRERESEIDGGMVRDYKRGRERCSHRFPQFIL